MEDEARGHDGPAHDERREDGELELVLEGAEPQAADGQPEGGKVEREEVEHAYRGPFLIHSKNYSSIGLAGKSHNLHASAKEKE